MNYNGYERLVITMVKKLDNKKIFYSNLMRFTL